MLNNSYLDNSTELRLGNPAQVQSRGGRRCFDGTQQECAAVRAGTKLRRVTGGEQKCGGRGRWTKSPGSRLQCQFLLSNRVFLVKGSSSSSHCFS